MTFEDKTLECAECREPFVFTAGEQAFFEERGFSEPRRCKKCRDAKRKKRKDGATGGQIYRSPAFEESAPAHQKVRGRRGGRGMQEYRSPGFRERDIADPAGEYRSPAFRESNLLQPEEEYRAPGFREYAGIDANAEYRAPAYQDLREKYVDQKPMFAITCAACGVEAMVPHLPDEGEKPLCRDCYRAGK